MSNPIVRCVLVLLVALGAAPGAGAVAAAAVDSVVYVFKAGRYAKVGRLTALHADDLKYATRAETIDGLFALAQAENRVSDIDAIQLAAKYGRVKSGDTLLLTCLKVRACNPDSFLTVAQKSRLHADVIRRNPSWNPTQVDHAVGAIAEQVMDRYFRGSGWTPVPGQVGRQGFDGLYIKQENGIVREVLIAESKYNTSTLKGTKYGSQMSQEWVRKKLLALQLQNPGEDVYQQIDRFAENGVYRAVLWHLRVDDEALYVTISKVKSKEGSVQIAEAVGTDVEELGLSSTQTVRFADPENRFQRDLLQWYEEALDAVAGT